MKKNKSFISLMTVAFVFACVMSCDEQDEKMEMKSIHVGNRNLTYMDSNSNRDEALILDGTEGDPLDLETAKSWTANFRNANAKSTETRAHYFGTEIIQGILNQAGCVGIRIYYALDENGEKKLLVVGVDEHGNDLLPEGGGKTDNGGGYTIADYSYPCPTMCSGGGGL